MKIKKLFIYGVVAVALIIVSCDKKDDETIVENPVFENPVTEADTLFLGLNSEESKEVIEEEALKMMDEMQAMESAMPIETSESFVNFLDKDFPFGDDSGYKSQALRNDYIFGVNYAIANYKGDINSIFKAMTVSGFDEEPENLSDFYQELVGVYSWSSNDEWVYEATGDVIKFEFPSTENGTSNDASFTIDLELYSGSVSDEIFENNLPSVASVELAVGSSVKMGYYLDLAYDAEGIPTKLESKLVIGEFRMKVTAEGANSDSFDLTYYMAHNNDVLVGFTIGAGGDWSEDNINENVQFIAYAEYYDQSTGQWYYEEIDPSELWDYEYTWVELEKYDIHKVITNGNASLQFMNLKLVGNLNIEGLGDDIIPILEADYYDSSDEEAIMNDIVDAINKQISLTLRKADDNKILADVEAYLELVEDSYEEYWYDGDWHETPRVITETYYEPNLRFVFADGSKIDFETYFTDGFDELVNEMEDWLDELEKTYGK